jgi:hypothetical protein
MLYHPLPIDYHFPKGKIGRKKGETMIKISVRKKSPWQQSTIPSPVNTRGEYKKMKQKQFCPLYQGFGSPFMILRILFTKYFVFART